MVLACLVCQLGLGFGYLTAPLLKDITESLGVPRTVFSSATSMRLWMMSLASPLVGIAVLRFGARSVLVAATLLMAPTFVWLSRVESTAELFAVNVLIGAILLGFGDNTVGSVVATWVRRRRGLALGIVYTGSNLAGAILTPLVARLAASSSWRDAVLQVGLGGAALILPFALFGVRERRPGDEAWIDAAEVDAPRDTPLAPARDDLDLRQALSTRSFWVLGFALAGFFFYMMGVLDHLIAALGDAGIEPGRAAGYYSTAIGLGLVSKIAMGLLADRIAPKPAIALDYALLALSSVLLLFVPEQPFVTLFVISFGFSYAARDVVYPLVIGECFGLRHLASIYGALMVVLAPAGAAGGIFAALCFDRFGSYAPAFQVYALVNLLVLASLQWLRDERSAAHD